MTRPVTARYCLTLKYEFIRHLGKSEFHIFTRMISAAPQLAGRIAVVTGAASGIGEACARKLFALGSTVVLSDVNEDRGNNIVQDLKSKAEPGNKADAVFMKVDMSKGDQTKDFSSKVLEKFGAVCCRL